MKRLLMGVVLSGLLIISVPVSAMTTDNTNTQTTQSNANTSSSDDTKANAEQLKARVQERKALMKTKLTNTEIQKLVSKCGPSQVKINTFLEGRFKNDTPYQAKYEAYIKRLENLSAKLKLNNTDTTELDAQIVILKQKYETFKTSVTSFRTAVSDTKTIDCKTDPTGFKASLDEARTKALAVKQANLDLETYARTTIKATLEKIKATRS